MATIAAAVWLGLMTVRAASGVQVEADSVSAAPAAVPAPMVTAETDDEDSADEPWEAVTIMGRPELSIERMYAFIKKRNPNFLYDVAEAFYVIGERYGVRGDIAICQAVLETGWFRFLDGTLVQPDQHNYGGLGVTAAGESGNSFVTLEDGVTAMIQHLYAYACTEELPAGESLVDVRFGLVKRGCAPTWEALSNRWAINPNYGRDIMRIYASMETFDMPEWWDGDIDVTDPYINFIE